MEAVKKRLGVYTAIALYSLYIMMFILRLLGYPQAGHWLASVQFVAIVPLIFLLTRARQNKRPALYIIQITLMLAFLLIEFLVDYVLVKLRSAENIGN